MLSGHFHGLGRIVTEDAGGIEGHTVVEMVADYQEFRTHSGERSTGFQRLLQLDLAGGRIAVDTFSSNLGAHASFPYDYEQFVPGERARDECDERAAVECARPPGCRIGTRPRTTTSECRSGSSTTRRCITEGVFVAE